MRLLSASTVRVGGHFLELQLDDDGDLTGWRLLCGNCLAPRVTIPLQCPPGPRPGLPVDGAMRLPGAQGWPPVTLAWGAVVADCDHPEPQRARRSWRPADRPARHRPSRVVFRIGLVGNEAADPVLVPGGLWVAVVAGHARRVRSEAFGVRHVARVASQPWDDCPA